MEVFKMKKFLNSRIMMLVLVVAMVFAMSATAFADTGTVAVNVQFTEDGDPIWGTDPAMSVMVDTDLTQLDKDYFTLAQFNDSLINPLGTKASVMDAIIKAANIKSKAVTTGVDLAPTYGEPGAYISVIDDKDTNNSYSEYQDANGQWWGRSVGEGWSAYITPAGGAAPAYVYLSRIQLQTGDTIRFDHASYDYTWEIDGPSTK